jgi:hypothetical protein
MKSRAEALRARAQAVENRARKAERAADLRRKILAGAWLVSRYGADLARMGDEARADFTGFLKRDIDRAAFGLPPIPVPTGGPSRE